MDPLQYWKEKPILGAGGREGQVLHSRHLKFQIAMLLSCVFFFMQHKSSQIKTKILRSLLPKRIQQVLMHTSNLSLKVEGETEKTNKA